MASIPEPRGGVSARVTQERPVAEGRHPGGPAAGAAGLGGLDLEPLRLHLATLEALAR
jgi:hypothetical protein